MNATTRFSFSSVGLPSRLGALGLSGAHAAHRRTTLVPDFAPDDGEAMDDGAGPVEPPRPSARSVLDDAPASVAPIAPLYDAWREATLQSKARASVRALVATDVDAAIAVATAAKGAPLSRDEAAQATAAVYKAKRRELDTVYVDLLAASKQSRHLEDKSLRDVVRAAAERVALRPDPFTDLDARRVLWEGDGVRVVVDTAAEAPKVLVVPVQAAMFPVYVPDGGGRDARPVVAVTSAHTGRRLVDDLALVAAHAADALVAACAAAEVRARGVEAWINPPQGAAFRQLHVHVAATEAPSWRSRGVDVLDLDRVRAELAPAAALLARRFGGA